MLFWYIYFKLWTNFIHCFILGIDHLECVSDDWTFEWVKIILLSCGQFVISIPPENIRTYGFLMFSQNIEKEHARNWLNRIRINNRLVFHVYPISGQCFCSITRKNMVFWCFQGLWNRNIDQKQGKHEKPCG